MSIARLQGLKQAPFERQQLGKCHVLTATLTYRTVKELLEGVFYMVCHSAGIHLQEEVFSVWPFLKLYQSIR
jgi:hypothetical protein